MALTIAQLEELEADVARIGYASPAELFTEVAEPLRPRKRLKVSESAEAYVYIHKPGGFSGWYRNETTPYLVEPMDALQSREHNTVCVVGPAQSAKTQIGINWMAHSIVADPADMLIIQTTRARARKFSRTDIERVHRHSPAIQERLLPGAQDDNTFDKFYRGGNFVSFGWPSVSEVSGMAAPRGWATDYDRMDADIDGEGSLYGLLLQRIRSFMSRGMLLIESSPGGEVPRKAFIPSSPHEAPPTTGILAIYNMGDRRRLYWPDPHCEEWFEPTFELLTWDPDDRDLQAAAESVRMACPHCGAAIEPDLKRELTGASHWLREFQRMERYGTGGYRVVGEGRRSNIASFWFQGPAAAFQSWQGLVLEYLQAMGEFERTGNTENLKTTVQQSQGRPFKPPVPEGARLPEQLQARAEKTERPNERIVPRGVRLLIPAVDVQKGRFEVQVHGFGVDLEQWIIDRYAITKSQRRDDDGERLPLNPASHLEDWDLLIEQVIKRTYPLEGRPGWSMAPIMVPCDSGGEAGVTERAYAFWPKVRSLNLQKRFMLVKGDGRLNAPRLRMTHPDRDRSDNKVRAEGLVPIWLLNTNMIKDGIANDLAREEPGRGYVHFPEWLPPSFYGELCAEDRTDRGWKAPDGVPNEGLDLMGYARAAMIRIGAERINWQAPPIWASDWDTNPFVVQTSESPAPTAAPRAAGGRRVLSRGI